RIDVGRTDLFDHRAKKGVMIYPDPLFLTTRLPLGHFELDFGSAISTSSGLINLYDGNATATITTQAGQQYSIRTRTLADEDTIAIEIEGPAVGAPTVKLTWVMEASKSSRTPTPTGYVANPSATFTLSNGNSIYTVPMTAGGSYGLGYKSATAANKTTIIASTFYSKQNMGAASQIAEALNAFDVARLDAKVETHEAHWHQYYTKSAYRMPDASLQSFYDMQLYKFACTARENGPPIDLQGPWTVNNTPWPGYWSNLNTELTYSPLYTANHLEIAQTLINAIDRNKINLTLNVPQQYQSDSAGIGRAYGADMISPVLLEPDTDGKLGNNTSQAELGNLTWILFYYYQHYRYSMDKAIGSNLFDILKKSVQYQIHLLKKNAQGKFEFFVKTYSPEYPNGYDYNTNYDLSILRWGLKTLLALNIELEMNDSMASTWKDIEDNLIEYPTDATGYRISTNIAFAQTHRHYSHLFMIYPFYLVNWDQPGNRRLIQTSVQTWQSKTAALLGYSFTGHASMQAMMGNGNAALEAIKTLQQVYIKPNTLYAETGPVIETPLSAATSLQELSLQYWNGVVRVFPAVPDNWKDLSFDNFRTDGAFLISGKRVAGVNTSVIIVSEKGGTIMINPNLGDKVVSQQITLQAPNNGVYTIKMQPGDMIELTPSGTSQGK
ncbi:hypothetical protein ACETRX_36855, partial [Labrys portucalensis]